MPTVYKRPVILNTRRKWAASAYKDTVVFKWAAIYKRLDQYLFIVGA